MEGQNSGSHQDMVKVLQLARLLSQFLAACKGHQVGLPNENVRLALVLFTELRLDLLLDFPTILDVDEHKRLDIAMGNDFGSPRAECAVCAGDEDSPAFIRLGDDGRPAVALFVQALPWEVFRQEARDPESQDDNDASDREKQAGIGHFWGRMVSFSGLVSGGLEMSVRSVEAFLSYDGR